MNLKPGADVDAAAIASRLEPNHSGLEAGPVQATLEDCYMNLEEK